MVRGSVLLAVFACAAAVEVTPIEKVINLIAGLAKEVKDDGAAEAKAYDKFACFCKDTTDTKVKSVNHGTKKIGVLSADIGDKTQNKEDDQSENADRKKKQNQLNADLDDEIARHTKAKAQYEAEAADMNNAISGLKSAIKSMKESKPSLVQIKKTIGQTLQIAEAMSLLATPKRKATLALIQQKVDPENAEYGFHSDDIIKLCDELLVDYQNSKSDLDSEWNKTDKASKAMQASLNKKMTANSAAMKSLVKNIAKLEKEIAAHRGDLVERQGTLQDDELYLKDLTARCEERANDYDQRSAMRNDELTALTGALDVLKKRVKGAADDVNERALLIQQAAKPATATAPKEVVAAPIKATASTEKAISLLQRSLRGGNSLSQQDRVAKALDTLRSVHGSVALSVLAESAAADPFKKVKGLIQKLIERLLQESANEATKKGFCDTELGKARKTRDYRFTEAKEKSASLSSLQAKKDALEQEIKQLKSDIKAETKALKEETADRKDEKKTNAETLKTAKEGLSAVNEALLILKSFYKQAAKAAFVQASPVDEDTKGAGFSGNYKGKQGASNAVFALLETISSDFDRTIRTTEASEEAAHRAFVAFNQASLSSISGKSTNQDLDEEDLKTTDTLIEQTTEDLQTAVDLLDGALKELEELKPTCMDTGMSYSERVKKREEEMKALGKALCQLDEDKVEKECQ